MSRRQRHLNLRHAGATLALDARFLSGADGSAVDSWTDRAGGAAFTNTGTLRPTLRTSSFNGQATVDFDGTDDRLVATRADQWQTIFTVSRHVGTFTSTPTIIRASSRNALVRYQTSTSVRTFMDATAADVSSTFTASNSLILTAVYAANPARHFLNGVAGSTASNTYNSLSSGTVSVGSNPSPAAEFMRGYISVIAAFPVGLSDALRRRIQNALALAFKIACS